MQERQKTEEMADEQALKERQEREAAAAKEAAAAGKSGPTSVTAKPAWL